MPKQTATHRPAAKPPQASAKHRRQKPPVVLGPGARLTGSERRRVAAAVKKAQHTGKLAASAQSTIPYEEMHRDGICRIEGGRYTKTLQFNDINYQLAQPEDKAQIFENWCNFLNYFDSSLSVQLTFTNQRVNPLDFQQAISIPTQGDGYDDLRAEYTEMLKNQLAKGNNGLIRQKYITFGIEADSLQAARPKLERIETEIQNNFKVMGVAAKPQDGYERLETLHGQLHPLGGERLRFAWDAVSKTGLTTKDFIAPTSFNFKDSRTFRAGQAWGAVSFLQILAPELNDRLLADFLDLDTTMTLNLHIQSVDQAAAIRTLKHKISDLDKMKVEEQKKAVRSGYDMDVLPPDLVTFGAEAKSLLEDLQGRNERLFLCTILVLNTAPTRQKLENDLFAAAGVAQKYNCALKRLDYQQEQGYMSSLPLGVNQIEIQRSLTTSAAAIFVPFMSQELFQDGEALYYGINALSNNLIMADRKRLKNPNGLFLGVPGCFTGDTLVRLADGETASFADLMHYGEPVDVLGYNEQTGLFEAAPLLDVEITRYASELAIVELTTGLQLECTPNHLMLDGEGAWVRADELLPGQPLSGGLEVAAVKVVKLDEPVPVYDMLASPHGNYVLACGLVVHNSGKSFTAKREIVNVFLRLRLDEILISDAENEYSPLVQRLGGQVVNLSPASKQYINPMDINLNYSEDDNPVSLKSDFILSLCELVVGGKDGLQPVEKTVIDRCVQLVYRDFLADPEHAEMPVLGDLYDLLLQQDEPEARRIATALEIYVHGSLNVFNHRTNVDLQNRLVCFNLKSLGKQLKKIAMLVMQDQVWNRVTANRAAHKTTWFYSDEHHLLLRDEQTAAYSIEIWKRFRKWGGIPTAMTQNVKDLLASREIETLFENTDFYYLLSQAPGDRAILSKALGISPTQLSYVTNAAPGEGLLFYGDTIVPFRDSFPKTGQLYALMTTRPEEVAAAGRSE